MSVSKTTTEFLNYSIPMCGVFVRPRDLRCDWDCMF